MINNILNEIDYILKEAIESIDNQEPVNGLEFARELIIKAMEGKKI